MRTHALTALTIGLLLTRGGLLAAEGARDEAIQKELRKLEGSWQHLSLTINGKLQKADEEGPRPLIFKGKTLTSADGEHTGIVKVDPSQSPAAIEVVFTSGPAKGMVQKGRYKVNANLLTIAFALPDTAEERFTRYDKNKDGRLSEEEMPESLRLEYKKWDKNKDGFIDFSEYKEYLRERSEKALKELSSQPGTDVAVTVYQRVKPETKPGKDDKGFLGPKWEYRVIKNEDLLEMGKDDLTAGLNKLGEEGWELVAVHAAPTTARGLGRPRDNYYFKRPVAAKPGKAEGQARVETPRKSETKVFALRFAKAAEAAKVLKDSIGPKLTIAADERTNMLVLRGDLESLIEATKLLDQLDVAGKEK